MNEIVQTQYATEPTIKIRLDENPAVVFLAGLGTQNSRYGISGKGLASSRTPLDLVFRLREREIT